MLMEPSKCPATEPVLRGQTVDAKSLRLVAQETAKLWRKYHLTYDQTKQVVAQARQALQLQAPAARRRTVDRLDRTEVERLIAAAYQRSSRHGLLVKTLFYTGARVSEFVHIH
jgi:integrase/recombinase XerD